MVVLLVKYKTKDPQYLLNWNKDTFLLRKSLGLIAVRAYYDTDSSDELYSTSFWESKDSLLKFLNDKETAELFKNKEMIWYKIVEEEPRARQGDVEV